MKQQHNMYNEATEGFSHQPQQSRTAMPATPPPEAAMSYLNIDEEVGKCNSRETLTRELVDLFWELLDFTRSRSWRKKALTAFMVISSFFVFLDLFFLGNIVEWIHAYAFWMTTHLISGIFFFVILMVICILIMIPPQIMCFVCGFVFAEVCGPFLGTVAGTMCSMMGLVIGATLAFIRARYMMRDLVKLFSQRYRVIRAADRAIARKGWRVFILLRLCPIIPFNGLNYIGGITSVTMDDYVLSLVGVVPLTILFVAAGATTENMLGMRGEYTDEQFLFKCILCGVGAVFCTVALLITAYFARKELERELAQEVSIRTELTADTTGTFDRKPSTADVSNDSTRSQNRDLVNLTRAPSKMDESVEVQDDLNASFRQGLDDEEWFWVLP